MIFFCSFCKR